MNKYSIEEINISFLRQWLNEDRIKDPDRLVTNEQLKIILGITALQYFKCACGATGYDDENKSFHRRVCTVENDANNGGNGLYSK